MSTSIHKTLSLAFLLVASLYAMPQGKDPISRASLQEMFNNIAQGAHWDMSRPMLWGYFFTHSTRAPLDKAGTALTKLGYRLVNVYKADKESANAPDVWWLHVERIEVHTVATLDARNQEFYRFARQYGLDSYDGMDVGPVPK